MQRRIESGVVILVGIALIIVAVVAQLFTRAPAFEEMTDDFRAAMTTESIATMHSDIEVLSAMGQEMQTSVTPALAESFGLDRASGALVTRVLADSPAEKAGLKRGDVLLTFAGKAVRGVRELQLLVASAPIGRAVPVEILRDGRRLTLQVRVTARDERAASGRAPGRN